MANVRIFVSAGETSGDLHAGNLIRAIRRLAPEAEIAGIGGPRMEAAGARLVERPVGLSLIGLRPILAAVPQYLGLLSRTDRFLAAWRPDVAVTVDCPGLHFLIGSRLRVRQIPTLWYIPPQLWAWASWRVHKLRRRFTRVACILPHEEQFFRENGVPVTYVGNPVVDHLREAPLDEAFMAGLRHSPDERLIAILPGSRRQEVVPILRRQLTVARAMAARHPPCTFVLALAAEHHRPWVAPVVAESGLPIRVVVGKTHEVQRAADFALSKSGTTTLELAYYETPMAVFYNISPLDWAIGKRFLFTTPYMTLPNVLAGRCIVPEYMQERPVAPAEIDECCALLTDPARRTDVKTALSEVRRRIDVPGTADHAAREVLALVGTAIPPAPMWRPGFAV